MQLTKHAAARMVQRNFPISVVETILAYGNSRYAKGAESVVLDNDTLDLVAADDRRLAIDLERYRGVYVVVGDHGQIITAARRSRRLKI